MTESPFRILVRMPNWLGDCVMATPALRRLRALLPEAELFLAGRPAFRSLFAAQPGVAGWVDAPGGGFGNFLRGLGAARAAVRRATPDGKIDLGLLFTNSFSTAAWLRQTGAGVRVGYNLDCRRIFLTRAVPCGERERSGHFIRYYSRLAEEAAIAAGRAAGSGAAEDRSKENGTKTPGELNNSGGLPLPELRVDAAARERMATMLQSAGLRGPYAVFAPASAYGPVKDWPQEQYRALAKMLRREYDLPVLATGGAGQAGVCAAVVAGDAAGVSLAGKTSMEEFAALLAGAALFVGGDSGGAHVAAALGIPTLVIFGVTNPSRTRPIGRRVREIGCGRDHDVKLASAEARAAAARELAAITPETAAAAVRQLLGADRSDKPDRCGGIGQPPL